ncbi:MAG: hypothetical protein V3V92_00555 [Candidatus Hydrothermarchaeales archaeon]
MEIWHWVEVGGKKYFAPERRNKESIVLRVSVSDLMAAAISKDYNGLEDKYLLSNEQIGILKTVLKNGKWKVSAKATLN